MVSTPPEKNSQWEGLSHILWENKTCLKPPTSHQLSQSPLLSSLDRPRPLEARRLAMMRSTIHLPAPTPVRSGEVPIEAIVLQLQWYFYGIFDDFWHLWNMSEFIDDFIGFIHRFQILGVLSHSQCWFLKMRDPQSSPCIEVYSLMVIHDLDNFGPHDLGDLPMIPS